MISDMFRPALVVFPEVSAGFEQYMSVFCLVQTFLSNFWSIQAYFGWFLLIFAISGLFLLQFGFFLLRFGLFLVIFLPISALSVGLSLVGVVI